jgi:long-subunit fatty acid transport protein
MKRTLSILVLTICLVAATTVQAQLLPVLGAQRTGTATAQFLKIGVGARATAIAEAFVAVANDASALYWNPAGISQFTTDEIIISHRNWFVDIRHQFFGLVYHTSADDAFGVSVTALHMDDMKVTTEFAPRGTGEYFTFGDLAVGLSYSRKLTAQFSFGATVRYVEETMDVLKMRGVLVDLGTYYWTGLGTARFSAVMTNFGNQMTPSGSVTLRDGSSVSTFQAFAPPTMFRFGFAFEPIMDETHVLTTSLQLNHPKDNSENLCLGAEYTWMKTASLRAGYKLGVDEQAYSFGGGVATSLSAFQIGVDYSFVPSTNLGGVHTISMNLKL